MKNWRKAGVGALCVLGLLAGCAGGSRDDAAEDGGQESVDGAAGFSLDTLRALNAPLALLDRHDTVTVRIQGADGDGNETSTARVQYTRDADGRLVYWSHYQYTENSGAGEDELWGQANGAVYAARMASSSEASLNCYQSGEYESYIVGMLPDIGAQYDAGETVDGISEQDGAIVCSVTTTYGEIPDSYYFTTLYYADPATNELLAMSVTGYIAHEDGQKSVLYTTRYDWSYDETYAPERELLDEVVFSTDSTEDACALTYFYPAEDAENGWVLNEWRVARGTYVTFCCSTGCLLYADAGLTQPIDDTEPIDTGADSVTVYVVPQEG